MIKYEDTVGLDELDNEPFKQAVKLGLEKKIKLYGMSTRFEVGLVPLYVGQIAHIKMNHPEKSVVTIDGNTTQLYISSDYANSWLNQGRAIKASLDDLRIQKSDLAKLSTSPTIKSVELLSIEEDNLLSKCTYWQDFKSKVELAVKKFPSWKDSRLKPSAKIAKETEFSEWLKKLTGLQTREITIIKKVLTEVFEEL
ncbi:TPA: hypothetical protein RGI49_000836 [Legionella pneumophila]|uniref:Uncharacterized protein n=1 Tax=Legionella pneumophila TaxID=446 RepID=A0AAP3HCR0_LEGPN|nr:hypothetical protein [Legionella pneumophila]HAT9433963.1 hypothetical protein [Legionella pneumophila subsp. pneumophila]MCZ4689972.1 hypothetical protein [Legionella pneumophila]MCZ4709166.1 hypothetical protein [Legionella pneumophila]MCZ4717906.1 hypothetical protein [Legionella pneumophila]MDW9025684.1 hypothetical protein [Legionella pneumophila]